MLFPQQPFRATNCESQSHLTSCENFSHLRSCERQRWCWLKRQEQAEASRGPANILDSHVSQETTHSELSNSPQGLKNRSENQLCHVGKCLHKGGRSAILSHYAVGLSYQKNTDYIRRTERDFASNISSAQQLSQFPSQTLSSGARPLENLKDKTKTKMKKRKHPKLWDIPGCTERCYVFFLVSSCVRAGTRSFYGSLLLMFSKIDSILPGTHLACCLSLLSLLNTLVSLAPVGREIIRGIQRHHWITFHASMILKPVFKNLKGNTNYTLKAISHQ